MTDVEKAKYKIIGLVDEYDEKGFVVGQYAIGSVQELPTEQGIVEVDAGRAEAVGDEDEVEGSTGESGEDDEDEDEEVE